MREKLDLNVNSNLLTERGPLTNFAVQARLGNQNSQAGNIPTAGRKMAADIGAMEPGERTAALHQVMNNLGNGQRNPAAHDPAYNTRLQRSIQGLNRSMGAGYDPDAMADRIAHNQPADDLEKGAGEALQKLGPRQRLIAKQQLGDRPGARETNYMDVKNMAQNLPAWAEARLNEPAYQKALSADQKKAAQMNKELQQAGIFQDPSYDMDREGEHLGGGMFGDVFDMGDGKVMKKGQIGREELQILAKLNSVNGMPNLINGQIESPFGSESEEQNNPFGDNQPGEDGRYFDELDVGHFGDKGAEGRFVMDKAKGRPVHQILNEIQDDEGNLPIEQLEKMQRQFWNVRGRLHKQGVAHGDMHLGNAYYDDESDEMSLIDFGEAKDNPMAALREAFGGLNGGDWQVRDPDNPMGRAPEDLADRLMGNFEGVRNAFKERFADQLGGEDGLDGVLEHLFEGGIRGRLPNHRYSDYNENGAFSLDENTDFDDFFTENLGFKGEDGMMSEDGRGFLMQMINQLYDGVSDDGFSPDMSGDIPSAVSSPASMMSRGANPYGQKMESAVKSKKGSNQSKPGQRNGFQQFVQKLAAGGMTPPPSEKIDPVKIPGLGSMVKGMAAGGFDD